MAIIVSDVFKNKFRDLLDLLTIESPGPYVTVDALLNSQSLQAGDLLQFRRKGYVHWGMYCGNESIIHLRNTGKKGIIQREEDAMQNHVNDSSEETGNVGEDGNTADSKVNDRKKKQKEGLIAVVEMAKLVDVANSDKCRVNNREKMAERWAKRKPKNEDEEFVRRSPEDAVKAARIMLLEEIEYDLKNKNCEHVCTKWKYNVSDSDQVNAAFNAAKAAAGTAALGGAAAAGGVAADIAKEKADTEKADAEARARDEANKYKPSFLI